MSNPLDPLVESLRAVEPRPEAVDRAVAALRRSPPPRLVPLAVGVAALSLLALWPRPSNGIAWAQIIDQPTPLRYVLRRSIVRDGRPVPYVVIWNDSVMNARRVQETPTVGRRRYAQETIHSHEGRYVRRDAHYATFTRNAGPLPSFDIYFSEPARLVRQQGFRNVVVEHDASTRLGQADRYTVKRPVFSIDSRTGKPSAEGESSLVAYVAPGTKRLLGWDYSTGGEAPFRAEFQTTVDYPDRIDPRVFALHPPAGVRLYDLDRIRSQAEQTLDHDKGRPLRLVAQDANRRLWVFWKGASQASVLGAPTAERVWTLRDYDGMGAYGYRSSYRAVGVRLPGFVTSVDVRLGSSTLRKVPVLGVDNLETVASKLDIRPLSGSAHPGPMEGFGP